MGPIGVQEMIVIFLVALVLFGPKKLPELGKTIAKAVSEFRRAQSDLKATFEREMRSLEQENESLKEATRQAAIDLDKFVDMHLTDNGATGAETHPVNAPTDWHGIESGAPTTVGASEVLSAESHGALLTQETSGVQILQESMAGEGAGEGASIPTPQTASSTLQAAEQTVARGSLAPAAVAEPAEQAVPLLHENPLHETQNS